MNLKYINFNSKRRFGIEIEINRHLTQQQLVSMVKKVVGEKKCVISGWGYDCNNTNWIIKTDSTCGDQGNKDLDGGGYEVASAVGKGVKHLKRIDGVTKILKESQAQINQYCGFHCQVEIKDFTTTQAATLLAYWCKIENWISHMVPPNRVNHKFCQFFTLRDKWNQIAKVTDAAEFWNLMKLRRLDPSAKRTSISLINYQRTHSTSSEWSNFDRPTVELRVPECSLDAYNLKNWTRFFVHFVETCANKPFPNLKPVAFKEFLEIAGLQSPDGFSILSPGLFETKCWLLHRLEKYCKLNSVYADIKEYTARITAEGVKCQFEFGFNKQEALDVKLDLQKFKPKKCKTEKATDEIHAEIAKKAVEALMKPKYSRPYSLYYEDDY